jgi:hypothetical protein
LYLALALSFHNKRNKDNVSMIPESNTGKKDMGGESSKNVPLAVDGNLKNSCIRGG